MMIKKKLSGSVTVFGAMIFLVVFSLFMTLIQSVYHSATKARIDSALALAAESAFAGYSNEVFNRYGIFVLKSSSLAMERTREVLTANMAGSKAGLRSVCFTGETVMTDNGGEPFYRQAVDYMKSEGIAGYVADKLSDEGKQADDAGKIGTLAEKLGRSTDTNASAEKMAEDIESLMGNAGEEDSSGVNASLKRNLENAAALEGGGEETERDPYKEKAYSDAKTLLGSGLTKLVLGQGAGISGKSMNLAGWTPNEGLVKSDKLPDTYQNSANDILFREYLLMTFNSYLDVNPDSNHEEKLDYGLEYIIAGKRSDKDNLELVMRKIFLIREGMNFTYILTHGELKEQAQIFATLLFGWTLNPLNIKAAEYGVIALWAAGESVADLKNLYGGKKVPLVKNAESWNLSLEGVIRGGLNPKDSGGQRGLDYKDYLRILLLGNNSVKCARAMDVIEMRMIGAGEEDFRMRNCIFSMGVRGDFTMPFGGQIYTREYEYAYSK